MAPRLNVPSASVRLVLELVDDHLPTMSLWGFGDTEQLLPGAPSSPE